MQWFYLQSFVYHCYECLKLIHLSVHTSASTDLTENGISLAKDPDSTAVSGLAQI